MKIFVLLSRIPFPIEKGDKLRAFHQIRCLSRENEIVLCALSDSSIHPDAINVLKQYCSEIHIIPIGKAGMVWNVAKALFNGKPLQVGYFFRSRVRTKIESIINQCKPDHIYCQLTRVSEYVKNIDIPKTLDYQDIFSVGAKRRAETSSPLLKMLFMMEYHRMLRYEKYIFDRFDNKTIISRPDRDLLPHDSRNEVVIVPNGVDHSYFHQVPTARKHDIVFTGNMGYPPNIDAAKFIAEDIFPIVLRQIPSATLLLAGANPHTKVKALEKPNITVSGWMPDIRESYSSSRIFIAPMRIGTGLQNKLLEAMAMGLPCITSALANQALGAIENEEILIGNSAQDYANHIVRLLNDESYSNKLAVTGHTFVKTDFSWEHSASLLNTLFKSTMNNTKYNINTNERR